MKKETTLNPLRNARRVKSSEGGGDIEHLEEAIESVDNSLIADVDGTDTHFYFDYKDGKLGFNTDEERGADTFTPFPINRKSFIYPLINIPTTSSMNFNSIGRLAYIDNQFIDLKKQDETDNGLEVTVSSLTIGSYRHAMYTVKSINGGTYEIEEHNYGDVTKTIKNAEAGETILQTTNQYFSYIINIL